MANDPSQRKAQNRALFNLVSPDYDSGPGCFAHFGRRLVDLAGVQPGARVLDIASGRGAVLFPMAERVTPAGEVVGIDLADAMALATSAEAERRGLGARVAVMDAEELSFPDESFDCVTCGFGIMFFPDQDRGLGQMRRVLKPSGRLALSTWQKAQGEDLRGVLNDLGMIAMAPQAGWITDPPVLDALLKKNGFANTSVSVDSMEFRYADVGEIWQESFGTGMRRALGNLDAAQKERALTALAERIEPRRRDGGIYITATALLAVANK
jgi:ubiquinone/menaquinone biosynthesis C-methylase UbiE